MNIHPLFVHFPIAFLTLYSLLEFIRFKKILALPYWFYVKAILVIAGFLGSLVAIQTGKMAVGGVKGGVLSDIVKTHAGWAVATSWIFGVIAVVYLVLWIERSAFTPRFQMPKFLIIFWNILRNLSLIIYNKRIVVLLAIVGLSAVTITGALGGSMVYGPDVDPFVHFIYKLIIGA